MISSGVKGIEFLVANTDKQALNQSLAQKRIQLGSIGLGAGSNPSIGENLAEESFQEIKEHLSGLNLMFIAAGMGGGTGTGAAPVIARAAKELDILTVGIVTKPFDFEGAKRMQLAIDGLEKLEPHVDTMIVIPNQNLLEMDTKRRKLTLIDSFRLADSVLHSGIRSITDLMLLPGLINLDFADVKTTLSSMGRSMLGLAEAETGQEAAIKALSNPLLQEMDISKARSSLLNITGGKNLSLMDVDAAVSTVRASINPEANIIFGAAVSDDPDFDDKIRVSVLAAGINP